jgi:hypothetical protein
VGDAVVEHRPAERLGDMLLPEDLGERLGPVLAIEGKVGHGPQSYS